MAESMSNSDLGDDELQLETTDDGTTLSSETSSHASSSLAITSSSESAQSSVVSLLSRLRSPTSSDLS